MSNKVKIAIGNLISGAVFITVGILGLALPSIPAEVTTVISVIGAMASALLLPVVFPKVD